LEDSVSTLRNVIDAKDREIDLLKEQLELYKGQVEEMSKTLRYHKLGNFGVG
jgi:peptidoglycan hydrolase CwlO-like protein